MIELSHQFRSLWEVYHRRRSHCQRQNALNSNHASNNSWTSILLSKAFLVYFSFFLCLAVQQLPTENVLLPQTQLFLSLTSSCGTHKKRNSFHVLQRSNQMKVINERLWSCLKINTQMKGKYFSNPISSFDHKNRKREERSFFMVFVQRWEQLENCGVVGN